ncbi:hypothetical protein R6Q59_004242 [Mikania micrantha]
MEPINSWNQTDILVVIMLQLMPAIESVLIEVFRNFNFHRESGLLQFWACNTDPEYYRKRCLERHYPFVGRITSVGNWLAGRAAQTGIADHRTARHVLDQEDQHSRDIGARGSWFCLCFIMMELGLNLWESSKFLCLLISFSRGRAFREAKTPLL